MSTNAAALARRLEAVRKRTRFQAEIAERRAMIGVTGAAYGFLEKRGTIPPAVGSVPTKLAAGVLLTIVESQTSGATRRMAGAGADALLALWGYAAAKSGAFIAGEADGDEL